MYAIIPFQLKYCDISEDKADIVFGFWPCFDMKIVETVSVFITME